MIEKDSAIPGIIFFIAIFVATISIEFIGFTAVSIFVGNDCFTGLNSFPLLFSVVLTAWVVALTAYFIVCTPVEYVDVESPNVSAVVGPSHKLYFPPHKLYLPSDNAYRSILFALIALSSANGKVDAEKVVWIEALHDQFNKLIPEPDRLKINKAALLKVAMATSVHGPDRIINVLINARNKMNMKDKESLIKLCFLISTFNGPISETEAALILDIASAIDLPKTRVLEL